MILTYEAIDVKGQPATDTVEAADVSDAVEQLRARGLYVKHIAEDNRAENAGAGFARKGAVQGEGSSAIASHRLPVGTLALFTRQMAMLLRAGSALVPGLVAIRRQMKKPQHVALLGRVIADVEDGQALTGALRKHPRAFDSVYCAIIAAGEASGTMAEMFERLAQMVGRRRAMRNTVLGALAYPTLLIVMCMGIFNGLLFFVLPRFNDMFVQLGVETPVPTRIMLGIADLVRSYWLVGLAGTALFCGLAAWMLVRPRGRQWLSDVQTAIPVLGRLRSRLIQAQVLRTMGVLLEARVSVLDSLDLVRQSTANRRFKMLFAGLENAVTSGGQLSTAFEESGMIEPYICQAVRTGEDSGNLGGAMVYCADVLDESNGELVKVVARLIEPLILILMGFVVGFVAVSLFMPLFDMTSAMN